MCLDKLAVIVHCGQRVHVLVWGIHVLVPVLKGSFLCGSALFAIIIGWLGVPEQGTGLDSHLEALGVVVGDARTVGPLYRGQAGNSGK